MANATIRKLITAYGSGDPAIISHLVNKSGILKTAAARAASHNLWHTYKKVAELPSFSIRDVGGSITDQTVDDNIEQSDLKIVSALQSEPKSVCENYPGGVPKYFEDNLPVFIEAWGQAASKYLIYGTNPTFGNPSAFKGFHQIAKEAVRTDGLNSGSNVIQAGGTSGSTTTIFAVKWDINSCAILFNSKMASEGNFLKITPLNQGKPVSEVTDTSSGTKRLIYQVLYESYLGLFSASVFDIAAYTQIQDASGKRPTVDNMDLLIDLVHGGDSTFIYCNRTGKRLLGKLKDSKLVTGVFEKEYSTKIDYWDGIPVVVDDNISNVEDNTLD